jgi:hypothetical protein
LVLIFKTCIDEPLEGRAGDHGIRHRQAPLRALLGSKRPESAELSLEVFRLMPAQRIAA